MNVIELPFNKKIGIKESTDKKYQLILDYLPEYFNHINTIHASAQFALAEATSGKYLLEKFNEYSDNILAVVRNVEVKYSKPAESQLFSTANIENIDEIKKQLLSKNRIFINVDVKIFDTKNNLTLESTFKWFIQKIGKE
jgi:hypothetical protein